MCLSRSCLVRISLISGALHENYLVGPPELEFEDMFIIIIPHPRAPPVLSAYSHT
jgi:hypothetical protein